MLFTKLDRQLLLQTLVSSGVVRELVELNDRHAWTTIRPALQIQQQTGQTRSGRRGRSQKSDVLQGSRPRRTDGGCQLGSARRSAGETSGSRNGLEVRRRRLTRPHARGRG